jgi:hypothetical protein
MMQPNNYQRDGEWLALAASVCEAKLDLVNCFLLCKQRFRKDWGAIKHAREVYTAFTIHLNAALEDAFCGCYPLSVVRMGPDHELLTQVFQRQSERETQLPTLILPRPNTLEYDELRMVKQCMRDLTALLRHPLIVRFTPRESGDVMRALERWRNEF